MAIFKGFGRKKRRKYPIKLDEKGKSARSRCFEMFRDNTPSSEIAKIVGVKVETVRRYHQQWKKNPNFEGQHAYFKELLKRTAPDRERTIELCARACGCRPQTVCSTGVGVSDFGSSHKERRKIRRRRLCISALAAREPRIS